MMVSYWDFHALVESQRQQDGYCMYETSKGVLWGCTAMGSFGKSIVVSLGWGPLMIKLLKGSRVNIHVDVWPKVHVGVGLLWVPRLSLSTFGKMKDLSESSYDPIRLVPQTVKLAVSIFLFFILLHPQIAKFLYTVRVTVTHYTGKATESGMLVATQASYPVC